MKTKIIYISGGEVFAPAQVRGAFDEVRKMLNLDEDTIIFGVPVDSDDVGAGASMEIKEEKIEEPMIATEPAPEAMADEIPEIAATEPQPEKKPRARKKTIKAEISSGPEFAPESESKSEEKNSAPILSVLGILKSEKTAEAPISALESESMSESEEEIIFASEKIEINDNESKLTIEDIFSGIEPLREEKPIDLSSFNENAASSASDAAAGDMDTDETLSKLASEFALAQKDITEEAPKSVGRIGKLKNILPFKKVKKDEPGLLGDLFGWAGVAANDDEKFDMPDFFRMNG